MVHSTLRVLQFFPTWEAFAFAHKKTVLIFSFVTISVESRDMN